MKRILNIVYNITRGIIVPFFNFFILSYGILKFGKENWGEYIGLIIWISLFSFLLNLGNKDYLIRKYTNDTNNVFSHFFNSYISRSAFLITSTILLLFFKLEIALISIATIFGLHTYNSFESLVIYYQKFRQQLAIELIGFLILLIPLVLLNEFNLLLILKLYYLSVVAKSILMIIIFKLWHQKIKLDISFIELFKYWPFFILGLSGMINSKIDLYLVNIFLTNQEISVYQTTTTAFLTLQSMSFFIIAPINKPIYRSNLKTINRIKNIFNKIAIPSVLFGTICIWIVLEKILKLGLSTYLYFISFLTSIPSFYCVVSILSLFKTNNEIKVLYSNIIAAVLNCIISLILLKFIGLQGAFISACICQWFYFILIKRHENSTSRL